MPIRKTFSTALALAGAVACGVVPVQAQAGRPGDTQVARAEARDLRPAPTEPATRDRRPHVTLRPSSPVVAVGQPIGFEVSSSVDGYGHLYVLSASGRAQVWMENVPIDAGRRLAFPTGRLGIKAAAPAGREDLMLIVTRKRIEGFFGYRTTRRPRIVHRSHESFKQALAAKFADLPHRQWGYARTSVRVVTRAGSGWGWDSAPAAPDLWDDGLWDDLGERG